MRSEVKRRYVVMTIKLVLFDFHYTLALGECQLDTEIHDLPYLLLDRLVESGDVPASAVSRKEQAAEHYQQIRAKMRVTGIARDLVERATQVLKALDYDVPEETLASVVDEIMDICLPGVVVANGADSALRRLADSGCRLGVVSTSGWPRSVEKGLESVGLGHYFSHVLTSGGERIHKSNPEIYRRAVARFGVSPGEAVHIGDQFDTDIRPVKEAGLHAIWYSGFAAESEAYFRRVGLWKEGDNERAATLSDATADSMEMLPEIIARVVRGEHTGPGG